MKKIIRPVSRVLRNIFRMIRDLLSSKTRFLRVSPYAKGKIVFFDKKKSNFFSLISRGEGDSSVLDTIFPKHCYSLGGMMRSKDIYSRYRDIVSSGKQPLIIDCGANIGASTYFFADEFPEALVIGIELESNNAELAKKNNLSKDNVNILHAAIGSNSGVVEIKNPEANKDSFRVNVDANSGKNSIKMMTISDIERLYPEANPFIAKIDIEGFEDELFARNTEWIRKFYLITLEIHDWMLPQKSPSQNFFREHSKESRDCYIMGDMLFSIKN
jgi:FkbM family methyltransferase